MSILRVSVKYKKEADLRARINSSIALRGLLEGLKKERDIDVESVSDISCVFTIDVSSDNMSRAELYECVGKFISLDDYEILVNLQGSEIKTDKPKNDEDDDETVDKRSLVKKSSGVKTDEPGIIKSKPTNVPREADDDNGTEAVLKKIDALIGADDFKAKAHELVKVAPKLKDLDNYLSNSRFLFSIDDGNGITTAATLLAELLCALGLIKEAAVTERDPVPFVDNPNEMNSIMKSFRDDVRGYRAFGRVNVIDLSKCYNELSKDMYRTFLKEVCSGEGLPLIVFRIPFLEDQVRVSVEESLSDQFVLHSVPFVPMSMEELYTYAVKVAKKFGYEFDDGMRTTMDELIAKEKSDGKFYGFRTVDKVVRTLIYKKAKNGLGAPDIIAPADIRDEHEELSELHGLSGEEQLHMLTGLDGVVKQIEEIVSFIEYAKDDKSLSPSFHMRFIGNPGTGKTTVARILGKMLKDRGILRTGVFFEYSGNDFIAKYVGHTAPKTAQMCRDAYGGVLFIDEAYALSPGNNDRGSSDYRQEALNTILTEMENHRTDMLVIMAGYEDEIDELMQHNPGLSQRMPYTIRFDNYSKEDLFNIFISMTSKKFMYDSEFVDTVRNYFDNLPNNVYYSPTFSNARYVRNLYERTIGKAVLRAHLAKNSVATLVPSDFLKAVEEIKNTATSSSVYGKDKSGATMFSEEKARIKFSDVCGQEEAKELLAEVVDYLKNPDKYKTIGARVPKGALLYGPPGTGKTMMAKAVAGEAGVPVLTVAGTDFKGALVSDGSDRVRQLFEKARKISPCIIFIDEIDSIGESRTHGNNSTALMQLLTEMDGFDDTKTVIVLAATNRPDDLDAALKRPGRFDRLIPLELPDYKGRVAILEHYLKLTSHDEIDLKEVGNMTGGFSGADLGNVVNEAAHRALREGRDKITTADLLESVEIVSVGYVKKNKIMSDKEKRIVCYHEIGHALVSALQTHTAPVKKITVIPRTGGTLGYVLSADEGEKSLLTKTEMENRIAVCVAGRASEELQFGEITTGASNDIQKATAIARAIVAAYGMTDEFGMVCFDISSGGYLGSSRTTQCSEATAQLIDKKVIEIVREQYTKAIGLLRDNKELLDKLSEYIYEKESITGDEFMEIFNKYVK